MVSKASDSEFMEAAFFLQPARLDSALPQMAKRLIDLGFWQQAEHLLSQQEPNPMSDQLKMLKAQIALERKAPAEALALLNGVSDPSALVLRANALMATSQFGLAEQIFADLNDANKQKIAAWHNQNAIGLRELGKTVLADLLELGDQKPRKNLPVLAQNRSLVDNSQHLRSVLEAALLSVQSLPE